MLPGLALCVVIGAQQVLAQARQALGRALA